jgi:exopolysaccharide production protein ExoZ
VKYALRLVDSLSKAAAVHRRSKVDAGSGASAAKFESIQALRALAATLVILFHTKVFNSGYAGVDIFFVISGFIMGTVGGGERPREFFLLRLIRIVPLYWSVTLAMCVLSLIPGLFRTFAFDVTSLVKSILFIPYSDPTGHIWPLVVAGWTLNYEMFFYLIFTIGLVLGMPRLFSSMVILLLVTLGLTIQFNAAFARTYTDPILLEFVAGMLLSWIPWLRGFWLGVGQLALGLGGLIFIAFGHVEPGDGISRLIWLGLPCFALVSGALALERGADWPHLKYLIVLGDASYSLYLLHGFIVRIFERLPHIHPAVNAIVVIVLSCIAAVVCYRFFELPTMRLLRRAFGLRKTTGGPSGRISGVPVAPDCSAPASGDQLIRSSDKLHA